MACRNKPASRPSWRALTGLLLALCCAQACSSESGPGSGENGAREPYPSPEAAVLLEGLSGAAPQEELLVRARTAAARLRTDATVEELPGLELEMRLCTEALALVDGAADFPWGDWIAADRGTTPALAAELLRAANHVLDAEQAMALAAANDQRETGNPLRIRAHMVMWERDAPFADARARNALFRETPRARDLFRPALLETVLVPRNEPLVDRLLLDVATKDTMESRARRLALTELSQRNLTGTAAICESIFDTESTDLMVRQEALRTIAVLEPERLLRIVDTKIPQREIEPILHAFMLDLRAHVATRKEDA